MSPTEQNEARVSQLAEELASALSSAVVRKLAARLHEVIPIEATIASDSKLAAVMALIRVVDDDTQLLFIKRAVLARDPWSGHVAFPGGRRELADTTLLDTAVRETREEMSMDIAKYGQLIGQLDDLAPRSPALPPIIVRPFVAVVPESLEFHISASEVADAFWVSIKHLRSDEAKTEFAISREGVESRFPAYGVGPHIVWGLTERIVNQLLPLFD